MITVVDACVVIAYLAGESAPSTERFDHLLASNEAVLAPSTVTELLSDPKGAPEIAAWLGNLAILEIGEGYWERAGRLRSAVRRAGRKAALGDALLAQACIDAKLPLLTSDRDFRAFAEISNLHLV